MKFSFGIPHNGNNFVYPYVNSLVGLCLTQAQRPYDTLKNLVIGAFKDTQYRDLVQKFIQTSESTRLLGSILPAGGPYVDDNRSAISINHCTQSDDEWVVMVDPDIEFPIDMLDKVAGYIQANPEVKIISCRVNLLNGQPIFYKMNDTFTVNTHQSFPFEGLKEFAYVGTGIIFIHQDVFVKMREVYGHHHFFTRVMRREGITGAKLFGDDFSFCVRARNCGFKIYGLWDVFGVHHKIHACPQNYPNREQLEIRLK